MSVFGSLAKKAGGFFNKPQRRGKMSVFGSLAKKAGGFFNKPRELAEIIIGVIFIPVALVFATVLSLTVGTALVLLVLFLYLVSLPVRGEYDRNRMMMPWRLKRLVWPLFPLFAMTGCINTFLFVALGLGLVFVPSLRSVPYMPEILIMLLSTGVLALLILADLED